MGLIEQLLYGLIMGSAFSTIMIILFKYKLKRRIRSLTGSHEKIVTVYEEWDDVKIRVVMTEWTWELANRDEWYNFAYHQWLSARLFEAYQDPLERMKVHWFGEVVRVKN